MSGDTNGVTSECNKRGTRQAAQAGLEADGRKPVTREATEAAREVDGPDGGGRLVFQKPIEGGVGACAVPVQFPTRPLEQ